MQDPVSIHEFIQFTKLERPLRKLLLPFDFPCLQAAIANGTARGAWGAGGSLMI
jgi:hypothetical protein